MFRYIVNRLSLTQPRMISRSNAVRGGFVVLLGALMSLSLAQAFGQQDPSPQPGRTSIRGTVRDANNQPVSNSLVRLEQDGGSKAVSTSAEGAFLFSDVKPGDCVLSAEKAGLRSRLVAVPVSNAGNELHVDLTLEQPTGHVNQAAAQQSADAMAFADKPNFTVAGITDWTAVGGHGSDASLRTSEALARETTTLKPEEKTAAGARSGNAGNATEAKLRSALAESPGSFEANHQLGDFCFQKRSYREAIPSLEAAYRIDSSNHGNEYELALAYKATGDYTKAREHIQNLISLDNKADLHRVLGELDEDTGDSLSAVREFEEAARLDPSEQNYFSWGSELLLHRAVWPAAEVFRKGTEAYPKSSRMLAALGAALFASANYVDAAARLCEASDLNPADPSPYIFLGKIDTAAPDSLACVESKLLRYNQLRPKEARAKYYYAMAISKRLKASGNSANLQQVESLLTETVALDPGCSEAYLQLGIISSDRGDFEKAIGFYLKAIEANPQLSDAHYRLGVAYQRTGDSAKATRELDLHDQLEKEQAAAVERQRQEVKQFLVVLQNQPAIH